jgi:hypothetical protein
MNHIEYIEIAKRRQKNCQLEKKEPTTDFFFYLKGSEGKEKDRMGIFLGGIHKLFLPPLVDPWFIIILGFFFIIRSLLFTPRRHPQICRYQVDFHFGFSFCHPFLMQRPAFRKFHEIYVEISP